MPISYPEFSLDEAKDSPPVNRQTITKLTRFIAQADLEGIKRLTFALGEEDINFPLLAAVEKALKERSEQMTGVPSIIEAEFIEAAKAWSKMKRSPKVADKVLGESRSAILELMDKNYPDEVKLNLVKAYLNTMKVGETVPNDIKNRFNDIPGANRLIEPQTGPITPMAALIRKSSRTQEGAEDKPLVERSDSTKKPRL